VLTVLPDSGGTPRPGHTYTEYKQLLCSLYITHTANEEPVKIQYNVWFQCLVPIYVFLEMKLCSLVIPKTELYCSVSHFHVSVIDLNISRIGLLILLQTNQIGRLILGICSQIHKYRNWELF
jgi:hypothetical protein